MSYLGVSGLALLASFLIGGWTLAIYAFFNLGLAIRREGYCNWSHDDSYDHYETKCGKTFVDSSESGDIKSWAKHCCYCGKNIHVKRESK
jgi:hypothetical protein